MSQLEIPTVSNEIPPHIRIIKMLNSYWISQSIYAVAKLGISDLLKDGSQSCEELAKSTNMNPGALYRLMRALASTGIFAEQENGYFALTPMAKCLQNDFPGSVRPLALMSGEEQYQAWGNILHSVRTGKSAFDHLYQMNIFDYFAQNQESGEIYDKAINTFAVMARKAIQKSYDFSSINMLIDVAGGQGAMIASILKFNPHMQGILLDKPAVIASAKHLLEEEGVAERCQLIGGDIFESVPKGGDAYILKYILHDWGDEAAITILKNCRQAMDKNSKVLVIEQIIPSGNEPCIGKLSDLHMLVTHPGGAERTEVEYRVLFESAGFEITKIVSTSSDLSVIEGIPI